MVDGEERGVERREEEEREESASERVLVRERRADEL